MKFLCKIAHKWEATGRWTPHEKNPIFICTRCQRGKYVSRSGLHIPIPAMQLKEYLDNPKGRK